MTFYNIEIECPYCGRIHVHRLEIAEPAIDGSSSMSLVRLAKILEEDEEMQEEKEEKK